jgi:uncharacterized protein YprB with RNaseH-like and TPR domain
MDRAVYLDIETTGLGHGNDYITMIGAYDGTVPRMFVHGQNMKDFPKFIRQFRVIVTYYGKTFDVPFIRNEIPGVRIPPLHIDLRYFLRRLGYGGGLKAVERSMGVQRDDLVSDLDGFDAVILWRLYQEGDVQALQTLIKYNLEDVVNLEDLMIQGYNLAAGALGAFVPPIGRKPKPVIKAKADAGVIRKVKRIQWSGY